MNAQIRYIITWLKSHWEATIYIIVILWVVYWMSYWAYCEHQMYKNSPFRNGTMQLETIR